MESDNKYKKTDPEYCSVSRACLASLIGVSACGIFYSLEMVSGWMVFCWDSSCLRKRGL